MDGGADHDTDITGSGEMAARAVCRDLNRNLTDVFGPCRSTRDGSWLVARCVAPGMWVAALAEMSVAEALRMSSVAADLAERVIGRAHSSGVPGAAAHVFDTYFDVGVAATASHVHVEVPR